MREAYDRRAANEQPFGTAYVRRGLIAPTFAWLNNIVAQRRHVDESIAFIDENSELPDDANNNDDDDDKSSDTEDDDDDDGDDDDDDDDNEKRRSTVSAVCLRYW